MNINKKYNALATSDDDVRYFIVTGGRGSGKSFGINTFLINLIRRGHNILFTRWTMTSAHISIIPEFLEKIELLNVSKEFYVTKFDITHRPTESRILFRGIKTGAGTQTSALKSLQGITTWVVDEAEELVDEDIFDDIDLSIREKGLRNRVILVLNPATKEHFIYKRFFESRGIEPDFNGVSGDTCYISTTYRDNKDNLSKSFLDSIALMRRTRPDKYKHQVLGSWLDRAEGVIFSNWSLGKFNNDNPSVFGQDFGFSIDPTVLVETSIDKKAKKIYIKEHYGKNGMTTTDVYEMNKLCAPNGLIIGDSAEPRLLAEVKNRGCNIKPVRKGKDSVKAGINILLDYELIIDPDSIEVIKELNNYVWNDKRSETPVDKYNHYMDAIRYAVSYQITHPNKGVYSQKIF